MPLLREYLEYKVNYVIRYQRIHIQQSHWSFQLQGFNRDSQHFGHQRDQYSQYGKQGTLRAVPLQLYSGFFSDNSLIPVIGGITTEMQPKYTLKTQNPETFFCQYLCVSTYIYIHVYL